MTIQHKSLKDELLYLIGRASSPLSSAELYEKCELADEVAKVAKAVANLQNDGKIVRVVGEGRARYKLAPGMVAPAPAGKTGRSKAVQADDAAHGTPLSGVQPAPEPALPKIDIPTLGAPDHVAGAGKVIDAAPQELQTDAHLADAIIARLKRDLGPLLRPPVVSDLDVTTAPGAIHISVQSVEINISIEASA